MLVSGEGEAERAADAPRAAGVRRRRRAGDRRMSGSLLVEPVPRLVGHLAVPGDKSISHRAVLIGALCDGETRDLRLRALGRHRGDDRGGPGARRRGLRARGRDAARLREGPQRARGAPAGDRLRATRARSCACSPGSSRVRADRSSSSRATRRSRRVRWDASRSRSGAWAPASRRPRGTCRWASRARTLRGDRLRAARRERTGQVGDPPCGPLRDGRDDRRRAGADARPHRADARRGRRARRRSGATSVTCRRAERLRLDEVEVPGDFSSAAPFVVAATLVPGSELHVHGVNLNPRRTGLLEILERMGARITVYNRRAIGGEPAGDLEIALGAARRDDGRGGGGAARDRRAAARRARRRLRARRDRDPRRRGAAREGDRPDRGDGRRAARARRARAWPPRTGSP